MGKTGWIPTPPQEQKAFEKLLGQTQGSPLFGDLYTGDADAGKGVVSAPYKSVWKFCPSAFDDEKQTTGDCVSHQTRNSTDITRAVDIDIKGEPEEWVARGATEYIYAQRGHTGEGMSTSRALQFVHQHGFMVRQKYGWADLSVYNASIGSRLGGRGLPKEAIDECDKRPLKYFSQVSSDPDESLRQIRAALANGYGVGFGAQFGVQSRRDKNGIAQLGSDWNHSQTVGAIDDRCVLSQEPLILVINSWGPDWIAGGMPEWGPIPKGSYLVPYSVFYKKVVRGGEIMVVGNATGYPAKDLPSYGTGEFL